MIFGEIGYYSLIFSLIFSIILLIIIYQDYKISHQKINSSIYAFSFLQLILILISFFTLVISFVISDFSLVAVYQNSHTTKPLFYKISGTWGNHEGSLLLWLSVLCIFSFCFLIQSRKTPKKYRLLTIVFQNIIIIGFLFFIIKTSNPFSKLFPVPDQGLGLNPILQDPALAIHPPILYVGYVGTSIIFSSALAAMIQKFVSKIWASSIKIWILLSWFFLTLGIMLGSIWAYYELGWGGFWFWDPVENVSLMPWLSLTALIHTIIILEKREMFHSWTLILSIITFTLSMNGTFLVRSGVLNSIHTFANDPERGLYILIFLFILIFLSLIVFFINQPKIYLRKNFFLFSKETSILINNWFLMFFLTSILIGTMYPLFLEALSNIKISVGAPFFNILIIPFLIPFLIFMAIGPRLSWIKSKLNFIIKELFFLLLISTIVSLSIYYFFNASSILGFLILLTGLFLLFNLLKEIYEILYNKIKVNIPRIISHFGFGLLVISIALNNILSTEININLEVGKSHKFNEYELKFEKISHLTKKNFKSIIGNFKLIDLQGNKYNLNPEIRFYNKPNIITYEANIKTNFFEDKFIVMSNILDSDFYNIRFQQKPFMLWIWFSTLFISLGAFMSIITKRV